jgi:hypothetical protein
MSPHEHLTVGEFTRAMEALERSVLTRFDQRFDRIEHRLDLHAERLVTLEAAKKKSTLKTAGWTGAAATVLVAIIESVKAFLIR